MHAFSVRRLSRVAAALAVVVIAGVISGCYDEHAAPPQPQASGPPPPVDEPPPGGSATGVGGQPGSALGGAKRAAHNTVDSVEQRQRELEKALEDQE